MIVAQKISQLEQWMARALKSKALGRRRVKLMLSMIVSKRLVVVVTSALVVLADFLAAPAIGQPPNNDAAGNALQAARVKLEEAQRVWSTKLRAAASDSEQTKLDAAGRQILRTFEGECLAVARTYPRSLAAAEAVVSLARTADPGPEFDQGLRLMEQNHLEDERIVELCRILVYRRSPGIEPFLRAVAQRHSSRDVRGVALLCLGRNLKLFCDVATKLARVENATSVTPDEKRWLEEFTRNCSRESLVWMRSSDPKQLSERIESVCDSIIDLYADVDDNEYARLTGRRRNLEESARALRFSLSPIGQLPPSCKGLGVDGTPIKLIDQRGKVVLLMFSANWCGPCKTVYGQLRELTTIYRDQPFTVMTVMADETIATVAAAVESGEISWPAIWDGRSGPIANAWGITSYPTIYLIGRDGRVMSKGLRGDSLDDEVARMLGISSEDRVIVDKRKRVWSLSLRERNVSEEELPKLLDGYSEVRVLDLSHNPISDEMLKHLAPLTKLATLDLSYTNVTDSGLRQLEAISSLKKLHLLVRQNEGTTADGRRRLKAAVPGLQISFVTH